MWQGEGWALRAVALLQLVLAGLFSHVGLGSESPDRECCDSLYPINRPIPEVTTPKDYPPWKDPYITESPNWNPPPVIDVTQEQQPIVTPRWLQPPEEPDSNWLFSTPGTTKKKKKTTKATTIRSGFVTPGPSSTAAISCIVARQLCSEQKTCNQILEVIPKTCGLELAACSTITVSKCQAALRTLRGFDYFSPTCLCKEPRVEPKCNQLRDFIFDHPCEIANVIEPDPYPPSDALPTCLQAYRSCMSNRECKRIYQEYQSSCKATNDGKCRMENWMSCQSAWAKLRLSPLFGCICPKIKNSAKQANCDKIFNIVNGNPCIDARFFAFSSTDTESRQEAANFWQVWYNTSFTSQDYGSFFVRYTTSRVTPTVGVSLITDSRQTVEESAATPTYVQTSRTSSGTSQSDTSGASNGNLQLRSTCHLALDACERDGSCNRYLDQIKRMCGSINCDRQNCMKSIRDFYENIPEKHRLDIAFCLCKEEVHNIYLSGQFNVYQSVTADSSENVPSPDEQCLRAQSILHPVCAQQPDPLPEESPLSCHEIANSCKASPDCREPLERFTQSCAVDSTTKSSCQGRPDTCRKAMVGILGTELRTNCDCTSVTADFSQLYDCIGWQRVLWMNPCTDEANKDYHKTTIPLDGDFKNSVTEVSVYNPPQYTELTTIRTIYPPYRRTNGMSRTKKPSTPKSTWDYPTWDRETQPQTPWQPNTPFPTRNYDQTDNFPTPPWPKRKRPKTTRTTIVTTTTTTTTTLPPQFCSVERPGQPVRYIREGYKKRLYKHDDPECSELCECRLGEELECRVLDCIKRDACNTGVAFYSHASPFYQAYRGACLCYSGSFVCSKPRKDVELNLPKGVYLFLGYSEKDEKLLKAVTEQGAEEARGAIQGMVSFHNVNSNKSECRIIMPIPQTPENLVLQAVMDEFEENREKGNLTAEILNKEKEECFEALQNIERKIMSKDPDMRSHVILSMIKVAAAEADVPPQVSSATSSRLQQFLFKGSCSSIHMAGRCCNWTNFLVVFNFIIILLRSNCQVIVAL